jgi:hypothetical protein
MKVERPLTDLTLPVPARADGRLSFVRKTPGTKSDYDANGVIDTVEIRRHDFQPLPITEKSKKRGAAGSGKGLYIDLWA